MARSLNVKITGDASSYQRALRAAGKDTSHLQKGFHALGVAAKVGLGAGLLAVGFAAKAATKELIDAQKVTAQTNAVLKSTGQAANVTAKHVEALGTALLKKSGIDDEAVKTGENMLLTFKKIRNESGAGNKIFDQATRALVDMDVAMTHGNSTSESLSKTAIRLGKALNDPVKGATALKRVGVDLDEAQKKQIATFVKSGDVMSAQKVILKELTSEFGGSAAALGTTFAGKINILRESLRNLGAELLAKLIPTLSRLSAWLVSTGLPAVEKFARSIDFRAIFEAIRAPVEGAIASLRRFVNTATGIRASMDPSIFDGFILGLVGAAGVLVAIGKVKTALAGLAALGAGGPLAIAFAGLAIILGGVATAFLQNRREADNLAGSYKRVEDASRTLHDTELNLKQAEVDVQRAMLIHRQSVDATADAQGKYNRAVSEFGPHSQQAKAALEGLRGAQIDQRQSTLDLTRAQDRSRTAHQEVGKAVRGVTEDIVSAADKQRNAGHSFAANALTFGRSWHNAGENAQEFVEKMRNAAKANEDARPKVAAAQRAVANLAESLHKVPSDTTIRFIVKTISLAASGSSGQARGRFGGVGGQAAGGRIAGARVAADSVPAMLSPGEFVVTGGGERMLESMTFPGVLNWLGGKQPRHFAMGGRAGRMTKQIEYDRLYKAPMGGGMTSAKGLVPQVLRALAFARGHGWGGSVISGFRTYAQQLAIWNSGVRPAARPGTSSHERGQAVDVSDPSSFDALMNRAPAGSQLFNLVPNDFAHFSVSGYAAGGRVAGPGASVSRPGLGPTPAPTPLAGLRRRIRALRAEERQLKSKIATVDAQIRQIDKTKKKSKAQIARRKDLAAESSRLHARLKGVQAQLVSLNQRVQEVVQHDYSELPISLQLEAAQAALTETTADDATALAYAQAYLESQLRRPGITKAQRVQLLRALAGVRGDLANLGGDTGGGGGGDTGGAAPVDTGDLEAQLAQANARASYSAESARLANAFVATGVFAGTRPGIGLPGTPTIVFNNLIPDADQIRRATEAIATGAGAQAYRPSSFIPTGY